MTLKSDGDHEFVQQLAAGEQSAYAELYDRCGPAMLRVAATMLGSAHDAQDAVQEVFLAVARGRRRLAAVENIRAYMFTALRRECGRMAKRRGRDADVALAGGRQSEATASSGEGVDDELARALAALPAEQREVLTLKIDAEMTFAELADALAISPNTAASRYRYALEKLRASLER